MDLVDLSKKLTSWASAKPLVSRLWVFGSRVRDDYHPESDLDIAIALDMSVAAGVDDSGGLATWMFDTKGWKEELQEVTGFVVDLQYFDGTRTPIIQAALQTSSLLVYAKSAPSVAL